MSEPIEKDKRCGTCVHFSREFASNIGPCRRWDLVTNSIDSCDAHAFTIEIPSEPESEARPRNVDWDRRFNEAAAGGTGVKPQRKDVAELVKVQRESANDRLWQERLNFLIQAREAALIGLNNERSVKWTLQSQVADLLDVQKKDTRKINDLEELLRAARDAVRLKQETLDQLRAIMTCPATSSLIPWAEEDRDEWRRVAEARAERVSELEKELTKAKRASEDAETRLKTFDGLEGKIDVLEEQVEILRTVRGILKCKVGESLMQAARRHANNVNAWSIQQQKFEEAILAMRTKVHDDVSHLRERLDTANGSVKHWVSEHERLTKTLDGVLQVVELIAREGRLSADARTDIENLKPLIESRKVRS